MGPSKNQLSTSPRTLRGEPLVWLTAAGLALGVMLTAGLLGLVATKGLSTFWPNDLVELQISGKESPAKMAGYIVQERERREVDASRHQEVQLYRGNGDVYGDRFVYIDRSAIISKHSPADLLMIERLEGGNAIGRAKRIELADGTRQTSDDPRFSDSVKSMIQRAKRLRKSLHNIESVGIAKNSAAVAAARQEIRLSRGDAATEAELVTLQQEFDTLNQTRSKIKRELAKGSLILTTAEGGELTIPAGELLHISAPNRAGFFGKTGEALRHGWAFLSTAPREANTEGGVFPALFGTVVMTLVMSVFVTPFGVIAAIYLREYAGQGALVRVVRISVNNLAGVPSIVFGVFGLAFFVYFLGGAVDQAFFPDKLPAPTFKSGGILWASLTLALLTVPVMIVATEEALASVPRGVREAALASGASKWQMIQRVVLPASLPGILTGVILAMARGAGEVAPLMIVGVVKSAPSLPIDFTAPFIHAERQFMHLGFHIYDLGFQSPDSEAAKPMVFATTLLLITIVLLMNLGAILLRNRLRKSQTNSSF